MISVVVPIYNQEQYLKKSIESLLRQSYTDFEIVAVNDGSTDKSIDILEDFAQKYSQIRVVNKVNGGLIDAIAEGINNSVGEFVAFMDPDDYIGENYLQELLDIMSDDIDIVTAGMYSSEISENETINRKIVLTSDKDYICKEIVDDFFWSKEKARMIYPIFQSRCGKLYRKSVLTKIVDEYRKHKEAVIGEDTLFNYLALNYAKTIRARRKPVEYYYCLRKDSSMTRSVNFKKNYEKCRDTFNAFLNMVKSHTNNYNQPYELYYQQIQGIMYQASYYENDYRRLQKIIRHDGNYVSAYKCIIHNAKGLAKTNMVRKIINELYLPVEMALAVRKFRSVLGKLRVKIGGIIH